MNLYFIDTTVESGLVHGSREAPFTVHLGERALSQIAPFWWNINKIRQYRVFIVPLFIFEAHIAEKDTNCKVNLK